jgi:hypothetical protein
MWNHLGPYSDDEDDLDKFTQNRLHLNLGRDDDGVIRTFRFNGAVQDALSWFGFSDVIAMASEVEKGRASWGDVAMAWAKAPVNKLTQAFTPVIKMPLELSTGQKYFPDVFKPRHIRDWKRHFFQMFSLEHEYDAIFGMPSRGYGKSWLEAVVTNRNAEETAYNEIRSLTFNYQNRVLGRSFGGNFSPNANALYAYRTALKYGDTDALVKAEDEMARLNISGRSLRASRKRAHPLGGLSRSDRVDFRGTLTPQEEDKLEVAIQWYKSVFLGN